jgi:hypothetical protein
VSEDSVGQGPFLLPKAAGFQPRLGYCFSAISPGAIITFLFYRRRKLIVVTKAAGLLSLGPLEVFLYLGFRISVSNPACGRLGPLW